RAGGVGHADAALERVERRAELAGRQGGGLPLLAERRVEAGVADRDAGGGREAERDVLILLVEGALLRLGHVQAADTGAGASARRPRGRSERSAGARRAPRSRARLWPRRGGPAGPPGWCSLADGSAWWGRRVGS